MEIIEIDSSCVCARISGEVPKDRTALICVAEKIFETCGRRLYNNPEIAVYSNGASSLVFVSRKTKKSVLHNFVPLS
ncbi:MAG: hypothetical protein IKM21_04900 [Oscillospiraceae bacterium]|nr:hypothetical protein [Oscillospiraceae bacterium]